MAGSSCIRRPRRPAPRSLRARMKPERRCRSRETPVELSYIQFEPEGGGIVVNASEQGLAFHAAAALRQSGPIQACVSPNPMQQIKLVGEIVWMDETKKSGGLRFRKLTADARNQILRWLAQTTESLAQAKKFTAPSCALVEETAPRMLPEKGTPNLISPVADAAMPSVSDSATPMEHRALRVQSTEPLLASFIRGGQVSIFHSRLLHGLATALLVLVFLSTPVYFRRSFRHKIGDVLVRVGENLKGNRDPQLDGSSSKPVPVANPSSVNTLSVPNSTSAASTKQTLDPPAPAAPLQTVQPALNSAVSTPVDRQNSPKPLALARARKGRSAHALQLWSALGAGDSSAEVPLAQLYLAGDGVPRSCDQARVLLNAASKNGNSEALRQLQQLKKSGCR
jgi:hypothetical protein